jgi:hypothetical protein
MRSSPARYVFLAMSGVAACTTESTTNVAASTRQFLAEAWADNWFAMYQGDVLLGEDSIPITTVRSFNAESFTFAASYPLSLAFVLRDYQENDTGLEYIETSRQQAGDGGFSFQLTDTSTGDVVLVSSSAWRCLAIARAPLDLSCEKDPDPAATCRSSIASEPGGWRAASYDDAAWPAATEYTADAVGPKDGYFTIAWDSRAKLIWSSDLKIDNTVLCRVSLDGPASARGEVL